MRIAYEKLPLNPYNVQAFANIYLYVYDLAAIIIRSTTIHQ